MSDTPPILPYATPSDTGVPEEYGPVEAMIDARCRPKDIRVHFRRAKDAVDYFARSMSRRFAIDRVRHVCDVCGEVTSVYATMTWTIEMPRKKLEIGVLGETPRADFQTHHAVCRRCFAGWKVRMFWVNSARLVAILLMLIGVIGIFVARSGEHLDSLSAILTPSFFAIAGLLIILSATAIAQLAAPKPIRRRLPPRMTPDVLEGPTPRA